jgi:hypothetical protein
MTRYPVANVAVNIDIQHPNCLPHPQKNDVGICHDACSGRSESSIVFLLETVVKVQWKLLMQLKNLPGATRSYR